MPQHQNIVSTPNTQRNGTSSFIVVVIINKEHKFNQAFLPPPPKKTHKGRGGPCNFWRKDGGVGVTITEWPEKIHAHFQLSTSIRSWFHEAMVYPSVYVCVGMGVQVCTICGVMMSGPFGGTFNGPNDCLK